MQLDDLREQLHALSARVPSGSVGAGEVFSRARRTVKRRRVARLVASLAVVAMLGTLAVVLNASGTKPKTHVTVAASTTTTAVATVPIGLTAEQLRAHDGVGLPSGWAPVDEGDARIWVPKDWTVESGDGCVNGSGAEKGLVWLVVRDHFLCPVQGPYPQPIVEVLPNAIVPARPPTRIVHGYRVYRTVAKGTTQLNRFFVVPQLGVQIDGPGELAERIVDSLAPSARKVALAFAAQPVPHDFRVQTENGVTLSIPSRWAVDTPSQWPCVWPSANGTPELVDIHPGIVFPPCPAPSTNATYAVHDGVYSYAPRSDSAPRPAGPAGRSIAVLHHGSTSVTIYQEPSDPDALDVFVRRAGSSATHALTVGLGRDGRVAGGVLASIEAAK